MWGLLGRVCCCCRAKQMPVAQVVQERNQSQVRIGSVVQTRSCKYRQLQNMVEINEYRVFETIGEGSEGKVLRSIRNEEGTFAVKMLNKRKLKKQRWKSGLDDLQREITILKRCRHPNLVCLIEIIDSEEEDLLALFMEYANQQQLILFDQMAQVFYMSSRFQFPSQAQLRGIASQVLEGICYIHDLNIVHRDIKPDNILFNDLVAKIADFGISSFANEELDFRGTIYFIPPQNCKTSRDIDRDYDQRKGDIWSFGCTIYCFAYLKLPFNGETKEELFEALLKKSVDFPSQPSWSQDFLDFMRVCLEKDHKIRPNARQLKMHKWIQQSKSELRIKQ